MKMSVEFIHENTPRLILTHVVYFAKDLETDEIVLVCETDNNQVKFFPIKNIKGKIEIEPV